MFVLNQVDSVANQFLAEIRDENIQLDRMRFRRNIERLGEIMAYELSKTLQYKPVDITTPLATTSVRMVEDWPILIPILRAAMPFYTGVLNYFDNADSGFLGAYRQPIDEHNKFEIQMDYMAMPTIKDKHVVIVDPMLATGKSFIKALRAIQKNGIPKHIDIFCIIASPEGIEYIEQHVNTSYKFWIAAIDECLNEKSYIIPGLGDAGDLSFGNKL